jgi:hypothetical protein
MLVRRRQFPRLLIGFLPIEFLASAVKADFSYKTRGLLRVISLRIRNESLNANILH